MALKVVQVINTVAESRMQLLGKYPKVLRFDPLLIKCIQIRQSVTPSL